MVRKCTAAAHIAVMEVDVRRTTRPPPNSSNKRKIARTHHDFDFSTTTSTSFLTCPSRRRRLFLPENSVSESTLQQPRTEETSTSPTSDDDASAFSCSSTNDCSEVVEESVKLVDLEDEHGVSPRRRETTQSGDDMESPAGKSHETSGNRSLSSSVKMPAESELEEFFIAAEKNIQKRFVEKYNYDIVEDVPLEGRYEWIRLKP